MLKARVTSFAFGPLLLALSIGCGDKPSGAPSATAEATSTGKPMGKSAAPASAASSPSPALSTAARPTTSATAATSSAAPLDSASPPAAGPLAGFVQFSSPEGKFEIQMPSTPGPAIETPLEVPGNKTTLYTFQVEQGRTAYGVNYTDMKAPALNVKKFLKDSVDGTFRGMNAKLGSTKNVKVGEHDGLDASGTHPELGPVRIRLVAAVGKGTVRQYNVMAIGDIPADRAAAYLDSFKITR